MPNRSRARLSQPGAGKSRPRSRIGVQGLKSTLGYRRRLGFKARFVPFVLILLLAVGWWSYTNLERAIKGALEEDLQTLLQTEAKALDIWATAHRQIAEAIGSDPRFGELAENVISTAEGQQNIRDRLLASPDLAAIRQYMEYMLELRDYIDFVVIDDEGRIVAMRIDDSIGRALNEKATPIWEQIREGKSVLAPPLRATVAISDEERQQAVLQPTIFVLAPLLIRGEIEGMFGLRIRVSEFYEILDVARMGKSGETYAFSAGGVMLSDSRFESDLRGLGLLPLDDQVKATLNIQIRDPGGDMTKGYRPSAGLSELPLTHMAQSAIGGDTGVDVDGYRDYRGVPVLGAWTWMADLGFGIATEIDMKEAYGPLYQLRTAFWLLFGLLIVASSLALGSTVIISRLNRRVDEAEDHAQRMGQYILGEKIGEGGMGKVFRAEHAMLQRPTAVKVLRSEEASEQLYHRFEREAKSTAMLESPHTVELYDFGITDGGTIYYVMELLDGIDLQDLVERFGPVPPERTVHFLLGACHSLADAHDRGLVHRDIKPSNLFSCKKAGDSDFPKVLDFGLVKKTAGVVGDESLVLTTPDMATGTPAFMAPEMLTSTESVDGRTDLYALGCVGYWLLTGRLVFEGDNPMKVAMDHVNKQPVPPSKITEVEIPEELEAVLMQCLSKEARDRPSSARALASLLREIELEDPWTPERATRWWDAHMPKRSPGAGPATEQLATND